MNTLFYKLNNLLIVDIMLSFLSCISSDKTVESEKNKEMLSWFKKKPEKTKEVLSHADYNLIFENDEVESIPIELLEIGELKVPTGQIVACDPLAYPDSPPFTKKVKPGKYPVKIYVAKTAESGDRYAVAKLEFSNKKAIKWVMALTERDDIDELTDKSDYFGFPVDAGLAGFYDYQSGKQYLKFDSSFRKANPTGNIYDDFFSYEFKRNAKDMDNPNDIGDWINFQLPDSELNITMFHSGYGDGYYPSYWGIDRDGEVTSLVIDFLVLLVPEQD